MEIREFKRHDRRKGHNARQAPTTVAGVLTALRGIRFYCQQCQSLESVADCTAIEQHPASYSASVILGCGHGRTVTVAVKRPRTEQEQEQEEVTGDYEISKTIDEAVSQ